MIITEYRWQCDFCGVVSPVTPPDRKPSGWVEWLPTKVVDNGLRLQFCCRRHLDFWQTEKTKQ